jgi:hypothetical protein
VYIDERDLVKPEAGVAEVKVRVNIWGMNKAADTDTSSGTLGVDGSEMATPLSELRTPKAFYERTEQNILSWMQAVGLLAPPSAVDKMVEGIIYKLLRNAPAESSGQVHARLLLTLPVEWFVVGNTLVISKSIVDTPADEAALAAVLAPAAASVLQSRPIQPISEAILQSRNLTLKKLDFRRSEKEIVQAEKEAMRLLQLSAYFPALANAAVFQRTAERYCAQLSALFLPRFGNGLSVCDPHSLLRQLDPYGPRKPEALPALPLHARLFVNGWTDEVQMLDPPQEDAPFQVLPIEFFPRVLGKVAQDRPAAPFPLPSAGVRVPATPPIR